MGPQSASASVSAVLSMKGLWPPDAGPHPGPIRFEKSDFVMLRLPVIHAKHMLPTKMCLYLGENKRYSCRV